MSKAPARDDLWQLPGEIGALAATVAASLQDFRPLVGERVQDDLEQSASSG